MPGQLGLTPILPPPRKAAPPQGGAGLRGGVNAAKGPRFPMPLDHPSSGLRGVSGAVSAPKAEQRAAPVASLRGVSGGVNAARAPAPPRNPVYGRVNQEIGKLARAESEAGRLTRGTGPNVLSRNLAQISREGRQRERLLSQVKPQREGGGPLGIPGFISGIGRTLGSKEIAGAKILLGPKLGKVAGGITSEAVNIPTQAYAASFHTGVGVHEALQGKPAKIEAIGKELVKGSAVAQLAKGNFEGAANLAAQHPLGTSLEVGGTLSAADALAGALKRAGSADAATAGRMADKGEITREPTKLPPEYAPPGGVTIPHRPYSKGLVRPKLEKAVEARNVSKGKAEQTLKANVDHFEAEQLAASRGTREMVNKFHHDTTRRLAGQEGLMPFATGLIGDPSVLDANGNPLYRAQLTEAIDHFDRKVPGETPDEAKVREAVRDHLIRLEASPKFEANAKTVYERNNQIAAAKRDLQPELSKHGVLTNETMRINKLKIPFRVHFRDQQPWIEPSVKAGETPFRLGGPEGRPISIEDVVKQLGQKGVREKQLSFVSTRPGQTEAQALRSGRAVGGAKGAPGHLSGERFMKGQWDPTPDALRLQHQTDAQIINKARGDEEISRRYVLSREHIAKLLESRMAGLPADQKAGLRDYIAKELRSGNDRHFQMARNRSAWDRAKEAEEKLRGVGIEMQPIRVAHPFATKEYRAALGKHLDVHEMADRMDPENFDPAGAWQTRFPTEQAARDDRSAGPVGLVHPTVANRLKQYERNLGSAHLLQLPSNFWRRMNVAYSLRHIPGVTQEMVVRLLANEIGPLSYMRGRKIDQYLEEFAKNHPDPQVKLGYQRIKAWTGGSVANFASSQTRHIPLGQLKGTRLEKPAEWWLKGEAQPIAGAPLKAVRGAITSFSHATNHILSLERRYIEHPPQIAGLGKHQAQEFKALTGQRMKVIGAFKDVEKEFLRGRLNPKAIDHFLNAHRDYWGDWLRSSPDFRKAQAFAPFARWYLNSLKFIYWTMPVHHPMKTGLLAAMETGTKELREAEGQGYKGALKVPYGGLLPFQQGSLPMPGVPGERIGAEYYEPGGAVSAGLEGIAGAAVPFVWSTLATLKGTDPLTGKRLEEEREGRKQPITDQGKLAMLASQALLEEFLPPVRYAKTAAEKVEPEKELALGKKLGIPPGLFKAIRPIREEKAYYEGGKEAKPPGQRSKGGFKLPEIKTPEIKVPEVKVPEIKVPGG